MTTAEIYEAVSALSDDERRDLRAFIDDTLEDDFEVTDELKTLLTSRSAELEADPSMAVTLEEHRARVRALLP